MKKPLNKTVGEFRFGTRWWEGSTQTAGSNLHHQLPVMISLNKALKVIIPSSPPMPTKKHQSCTSLALRGHAKLIR